MDHADRQPQHPPLHRVERLEQRRVAGRPARRFDHRHGPIQPIRARQRNNLLVSTRFSAMNALKMC